MRSAFLAAALMCSAPALAQVSIHIDRPGVSIGINVPVYPALQRVPGYPVYYAPAVRTNYFFYDGLYWVYDDGEWFSSVWFNGPWHRVERVYVPAYLLRVPVRYYRDPPPEFRRWRVDAPPRWHEYWGPDWAARRAGWDRWTASSAPPPAPLPLYQRDFSGARYPAPEQQAVILVERYRYTPREEVARRLFEERKIVAEKRKKDGFVPPGHRRDERGLPEHARGIARGHDRDGDRGPPRHAMARGHDKHDKPDKYDKDKPDKYDKYDKRDKHDKDKPDKHVKYDKPDKPDKEKKDKKDKRDKD